MMELRLEGVEVRQGAFLLEAQGRFRAGCLGLAGKSGGGKTTLLELLAGLRRPTRGRVLLGKRVLDDAETGAHVEPRDRCMGYVPQDADLFPHLGVRGNLLFGAARAAASSGRSAGWDAVVHALGLEGLLDREAQGLSGGERRRVALGRALLSGPELLLLDEPFAGLDAESRRSVREGLKALREGFAVPWLLVSHDPGDLRGLCDCTLRVRDGIFSED